MLFKQKEKKNKLVRFSLSKTTPPPWSHICGLCNEPYEWSNCNKLQSGRLQPYLLILHNRKSLTVTNTLAYDSQVKTIGSRLLGFLTTQYFCWDWWNKTLRANLASANLANS